MVNPCSDLFFNYAQQEVVYRLKFETNGVERVASH
jgi:hypothetical protein